MPSRTTLEVITRDILSHKWKIVSKEFIPKEKEFTRVSSDSLPQIINVVIGDQKDPFKVCKLVFSKESFSDEHEKFNAWKNLECDIKLATAGYKYHVYIDSDVIEKFW